VPAGINETELRCNPVVRHQSAGGHIEEVLGLLVATTGPVTEPDDPVVITPLERRPCRVELLVEQQDSAVGQVAPDRRGERPI
jgi:hypothetical protein